MARFDPVNSGYIEVKDRIGKFYEAYPDGRIETHVIEQDDTRVTVRAEVYTSQEAESPRGVGHSWLTIPGKTPYTKDSELENAETSAVGRAIAFAGFEVHKSVASAEEVAMKQDAEEEQEDSAPTAEQKKEIRRLATAMFGKDWKQSVVNTYGVDVTGIDHEQAGMLIAVLEAQNQKEATDVQEPV